MCERYVLYPEILKVFTASAIGGESLHYMTATFARVKLPRKYSSFFLPIPSYIYSSVIFYLRKESDNFDCVQYTSHNGAECQDCKRIHPSRCSDLIDHEHSSGRSRMGRCWSYHLVRILLPGCGSWHLPHAIFRSQIDLEIVELVGCILTGRSDS